MTKILTLIVGDRLHNAFQPTIPLVTSCYRDNKYYCCVGDVVSFVNTCPEGIFDKNSWELLNLFVLFVGKLVSAVY